MTTHSYRITGQILHSQSDHGFAHLRVEIWDFGPFLVDLIASTATDDDGRFAVEFTQPYYAEFLPFHHHPHLLLKLFQGDLEISLTNCPVEVYLPGSTEPHKIIGPVLWNIWPGETRIVIRIDRPDAFAVHGVVRRAEGTPVGSVPVKAFDVDLWQEYLLGETTTDPDGRYRISYGAAQFHRPGQNAANLLVRAYVPGVEPPLESPVRFSAGSDETIDLTVGGAFVVRGAVRQADGTPIAGAVVRAFDQDLRREQPLGDAITDATGGYLIRYTAAQFCRPEKTAADLIVRAYDRYGNLLAESPTISHARPEETVDLTVGAAFVVKGIVRQADGTPIAGVPVKAFDSDQDLHQEYPLGETTTDPDGRYRISYGAAQFHRPGQNAANLLVRAYVPGVEPPLESPVRFSAGSDETIDLTVGGVLLFVVKGAVRQADGTPMAGAVVRAFDQDLRREQPLGDAITDATGGYLIRYTAAQFCRAEKKTADLIVRAHDRSSNQLLAESPLIFNAGADETIDLSVGGVYRGPSEYTRLVDEITPLLEGLSPADLEENDEHHDISFLTGETGEDAQRITFLVLAHRLMNKTSLAADIFYGLFREGLPTDLPTLLTQSPDLQRRALVQAIDENIIPKHPDEEIDRILERLKQLIADLAHEPPQEPGQITPAQLLSTVLPEAALTAAFLSAYVNHSGVIEDFWKDLRNKPEFGDRVENIQLALQLGALTGNHLPLVQELQRRKQAGEIGGLSDLARFGENEWHQIITGQSGNVPIGSPPDMPGNDDQEKARNYARVMAYMIEDAFPTRFLVERLRTDDLPDRDDLIKFFEANPDFNLRSSRVGSYLSGKPEPLVRRIRAMQRIYKLAPRHAQMSVLLKDGVDSAHRVARMGRNVFTARFGESLGSRAQAGQIYENALQVRAMAMTLLSAFGPNTGRVPMRAVPDVAPFGPDTDRVPIRSAPDAPMRDVDDGVPDWSTLFGTLDLCECESCRSIHGPAAYLVDVLHFLSDRKVIDLDRIERNEQGDITKVVFRQKQKTLPDGTNTITDLSVKDVLFERRPDLGEIELTCENTDTLVPYVDLVNEALENAVAPPPDFAPSSLPADLETDLNGRSQPPSDRLRAAFNPQLSAEAVITVGGRGQPWPNPDPWWTIDEPAFTYTIRKEGYDLRLMSWGDGSGVQPSGNNLLIVGADNNGLLHIRIFDAGGNLTDTDETRLPTTKAGAISTLKQQLPGLLPPHVLTSAEKAQVISEVTSILGQTQLNVVSRSRQTKGSAAERAANPQYINLDAYEILRQAVYPWTLPYDLWSEEIRTYLGHLGVPRHRIIEIFLPGADRREILSTVSLACEYLGLTPSEADIITGKAIYQPGAASAGPWNLWGFTAKELSPSDSIPDPADSTRRIVSGHWLAWIKRVDVFLQQSGLKYKELLELLDTHFINPIYIWSGARTIQIVSIDSENRTTCETAKLQLSGLTGYDEYNESVGERMAVRMVQFVRLWRKLGWSMRDLDRAITAFRLNPNHVDITDEFLIQLSHVQRLHHELNMPVIRLFAWWAEIDRGLYIDHGVPGQPRAATLYDQLFRNKAVINPPDTAFTEDPSDLGVKLTDGYDLRLMSWGDGSGVQPSGNNLLIVGADNNGLLHIRIFDAGGNLTDTDETRLPTTKAGAISTLKQQLPGLLPPHVLTSAEKAQVISEVTSILGQTLTDHGAAIAAALGISADDFSLLFHDTNVIPLVDDTLNLGNLSRLFRHASLARALGLPVRDYLTALELINTNPFTSTTETLLFVEKVGKVRASGFSLEELDYLLRHRVTLASGVAPDEQTIAMVLDEIRGGLQTIAAENTFRADPTDPGGLTTDPSGALTRQKLALLNLGTALVERVVATFNGAVTYAIPLDADALPKDLPNATGTYEVDLATLPAGFAFPAQLKDAVTYDEKNRKLKASRILSPPERALLRSASPDSNFTAAVDVLVRLQDELQGTISYDRATGTLRLVGPMTQARKTRLKNVSTDPKYQAAIDALFDQPRQFLTRHMRTFSIPDFSTNLVDLPKGLKFPESLKDKIYFDSAAEPKRLHFVGVMTEAERDVLLGLSIDPNDPNHAVYQTAINDLFNQADHVVPAVGDAFITDSDGAAMFDEPTTPEVRFLSALKKLLPYLRQTLSERLVEQRLAQAFQLEAKVAEALLTRRVASPVDPETDPQKKRRAMAEFLHSVFAESSPKVSLTSKAFPAQFTTFTLLHKVATLVSKFKVTARQLDWLFEYGPEVGWLDLNTLPAEDQKPAATFEPWLRLVDLFALRDRLPAGEQALEDLFTRARTAGVSQADLLHRLGEYTRWNEGDLNDLVGPLGFHWAFPDAFRDERALTRLLGCFDALKRLGMSAQLCCGLARLDTASAKEEREKARRQVVQAVRAKYDEAQWLNLAKPLRDVLRERQRAALVAYLASHLRVPLTVWEQPHPDLTLNDKRPAVKELQQKLNAAGANPVNAAGASPVLEIDGTFGPTTRDAVIAFQRAQGLPDNGTVDAATWAALDRAARRSLRDANDLYAHYLIDVEMSPCMMTSRIKQAHSSVQLFVQRCLMNLEPEVAAIAEIDEAWDQWNKWMKNYRVWEANRKIYLYPENWIEPELRDDKSPFFKELESELLQSDLTRESAETAFLNYLNKLDQVARLEIVGMYHQLEETQDGKTAVDVLHVFGRTYRKPRVYYYRQWVNKEYWTAWERVDLDIEGDHLIPVVWDRRLYLFLPKYAESRIQPLTVSLPQGAGPITAEPSKFWEVKLDWSVFNQGKWATRRESTLSYLLEPYGKRSEKTPPRFIFRSLIDDRNRLSIIPIHIPDMVQNYRDPSVFELGSVRSFEFASCNSEPVDGEPNAAWLGVIEHSWIENTQFDGMFLSGTDNTRLYLPTHVPITPSDTVVLHPKPGPLPSPFRLLPHADGASFTEHPFFYLDATRTFFVTPRGIAFDVGAWFLAKTVDPVRVPVISKFYIQRLKKLGLLLADRLGPVDVPGVPMLFEPSSPMRPGPRMANGGGILSMGRIAAVETQSAGDVVLSRGMGDLRPRAPWISKYSGDVGYEFSVFYHPYVNSFISELSRNGLDGLFQRLVQEHPERFLPRPPSGPPQEPLNFEKTYGPNLFPNNSFVTWPYPQEILDFGQSNTFSLENSGPYSLDNWELFFHAPLLIADRLSKNQRFEEAQWWLKTMFDPTDTSSEPVPKRYWKTKPFSDTTHDDYQNQSIQYILWLLAAGGDPKKRAQLTGDQLIELSRLEDIVERWRKDPFKPHLIARMRPTAYQKMVVMKYLDNLIAWADQLFRRDTIESINEATQLYILAAEILGRRPEDIPPRAFPRVQTYNSLETHLGAFSDAMVRVEEFVSPSAASRVVDYVEQMPLTLPAMQYFCTPKNDKLLGYWDTVADRLFKIRHCMNIEGVVRSLSLFELPIEPGLLVRAAAAGVDISSALNDINAALPHYRFNVLAQKATELCAELKSLGSALLAALEKKDAEELALTRAKHETALLERVEHVKQQQVEEAARNLMALSGSRHVAVARYLHYQKLLGVQNPQVPAEPTDGEITPISDATPSQRVSIPEEGDVKMIPLEKQEMESLQFSHGTQIAASGFDLAASTAHGLPTTIEAPWGVGIMYGGSNVGQAMSAFASYLRLVSSIFSFEATLSGKQAQYLMRSNDWTLQNNLAAREIMQIDQQTLAAKIRLEIANTELENHRKQIEDAQQIEDYLRSKYTKQELYGWMVGQISAVYFQTYQLAYDVAKRAERAYRFELGLKDSNFIQFGYWDSLKKGLLAGEKLHYDLKRMEMAYLDQNKREYEITKHVSLNQLDPLALIQLRQTGECFVSLPEALFDLDYPGHYLRRIKSVSLTIPCVTGPYTTVNCTLTLLKHSIRHANTLLGQDDKYARQEEDPRFTDSIGAIESIVTSSGQNDSGLFETNLRDERYLQFEGSGAISEWRLELPRDLRQFDYDTISDVILHMRYTAREGGEPLKQRATIELQTALNEFMRSAGQSGLARVFSLRHEFSSDWYRFLNPPAGSPGYQTLTMALAKEHLPFLFQGKTVTIQAIELFVKLGPDALEKKYDQVLKISLDPGKPATPKPMDLTLWNGVLRGEKRSDGLPGDWTLTAWLETGGVVDPKSINDIYIILNYKFA